jgi:hypothetical protein
MVDHSKLKSLIEHKNSLYIESMNEITKLNLETFNHAIEFDTYEELYTFIKKFTKSNEEFNTTMLYCRNKFLSK